MPDMDGFETAALIRQRPRCELVPIIFVSAVNYSDTHLARGYSLGAVDYISAPIVPEILRAKVSFFIELHKKNELLKRQAELETELIRAQAAREQAEAASSAKDRVLAMLSHELRTPLTPILLATSILSEAPSVPDEIRNELKNIARNVELEARPRSRCKFYHRASDTTVGRSVPDRRASTRLDRGRDAQCLTPLPPNRAGGSPAPGSPVGGCFHEDRQAAACACLKENKPAVEK